MTEDEAFANLMKIRKNWELLWWVRRLAVTGGVPDNANVTFTLWSCRITDRKGRMDPVTRAVAQQVIKGTGKGLQLVPLRKK